MPNSFRFAIAASFTAEPLQTSFDFWQTPLQSEFESHFAPFGQILQTILDPGSIFAENSHGINVVLFRLQDLGEASRRIENAQSLMAAVEARMSALQVPMLIVADVDGEGWWREVPGVYLLQPRQIDFWYPVDEKLSPDGERLGGIPYTEDYFIALGSSIVRAAHSIHKAQHKVLALDCDNTIWKGICGEDGPAGVVLSAGHLALQRFALRQRELGLLLVISSKNNEQDVCETFIEHPEFPLQLNHFISRRINWQPKYLGLASMAAELSLSLDSFVFLDDNSKEISEIDEQLPQVLGITLPPDSEDFETFLNHIWAFDQLKVTQADQSRAASYEGVQEFGKALNESGSLEHFYEMLELQVEIRPIVEDEVPRAAQLTQRTNQFNFTTIRRTEAEILNLKSVYGVHVRDRFGNYGFTGLLIGRPFGRKFLIENFLLSCRVLGRGVEHRVFAWLGEEARALGCAEVEIPFVESSRNAPAREFYESVPSPATVETLASLRFEPRRTERAEAAHASAAPAQHSVDYAGIARRLNRVRSIRQQMKRGSGIELETGTESLLASIWQDLLACETVSGESNFFDLGGHSLKVVLMLMRIHEVFGVSL
ncbi:MAG: HAD-IIIC family phosphatase, partial [Acidobacteria bacterium]|nr:HAD-IIIC family phosphatase [Acidobacteriota bacterium]